jgi:hypothetical protein
MFRTNTVANDSLCRFYSLIRMRGCVWTTGGIVSNEYGLRRQVSLPILDSASFPEEICDVLKSPFAQGQQRLQPQSATTTDGRRHFAQVGSCRYCIR